MKRISILTLFAFLLFPVSAISQNDFYEEFSKLEDLPKINELVYNGSVTPIWIDNNTFWYQTRERDGQKYYRVNISKKSKEPVNKEELVQPESATKRERARRDTISSPDNRWAAFIKDSDIWIKSIENGKEYRLSYDGTQNNAYLNIYWSDDSKKIAAIKKQQSSMRKIPLIESSPANQLQPVLQWRDYYKPGDLIPIYRPALFDVESLSKIDIDTRPYDDQYYLKFGKWRGDSKSFTFEYNQRGHQLYQLVSVDASSGSTFVMAQESSETFIYYNRIYTYYFKDDNSIIWASERDNWRHLYHIDARTGEIIRQLTKGEWVVRDVLHIDEDKGYMIISGNGRNADKGEDPYNIHYYRINIKNGHITDLTPENGNHKAYFSPDWSFFVDVCSKPDMSPLSLVRSAKDGRIQLHLQKSDIKDLLDQGFTMPEVFTAKGRDGKTDIWGTIFRPSDFDATKSYPVVEYIYAGPHDSFVLKDFYAYTRFSKLLELGFIVVTIDGMGTANRSKEFHDVAWRNLKDSGFPDRILWIKEAAKHYPYMDIERMGIYGYSAGGQSTMAALLFHGDFYKVGVALCGCHDNRMDKIWWNEQWMGYPVGPWYSENSNVDNAHLLQGKLLLINGELDDNVDPTSTLQVVNALIKADKDFEQLYLPGYGHNLGDNYVTRKVFEFLSKYLR